MTAAVKVTTKLMRFVLYLASFLVLAVSLTLYFFPGSTDVFFSWTINPPLTAAFLGAGYLASFFLEFFSAREKIWANARTAVPAVWVFTLITLVITLLHRDRFHFSAPQLITVTGTWFWLIVYATVPLLMGLAWIQQTRQPGGDPPRRAKLPAWLRLILSIQGILMLLSGVVMLLAPQSIIPAWPWDLSVLTSQAIGAWGVGVGIIALQAVWENEWRRLRAMMPSLGLYGLLQLLNFIRFQEDMIWSRPSAWIVVIFFAALLTVGLYGIWQLRREDQS